MARFLFLTRTRWTEPPRLRHQLARLLAGAGHQILFLEQPGRPWSGARGPAAAETGIRLAGWTELIHHKLRLAPLLHRLNAVVVKGSLRGSEALAPDWAGAVVVNFNYDFWFLRQLYPRNRIVTIINDDFVSTAPLGLVRPLAWALERTCRASDRVLTVSVPLQERLAPYTAAELFLPWSDRPYTEPAPGPRDILLFWGFVNRKLDFELLTKLARWLAAERPGMRLLVVGPTEQGTESLLVPLVESGNVDVRPASTLEGLPLDRVLAGLIPYRSGSPDIDAIMLPNKALQLMARGIPLLISGMPHFIQAPYVFRLDGPDGPAVVDSIESGFRGLQPYMRAMVAENTAAARLRQFEEAAGIPVTDMRPVGERA